MVDIIGGRHLALAVDCTDGVSVHGIRDQLTGHQFLARPSNLFKFAVNNGPPRDSSKGLEITGYDYTPTSQLSVFARGRHEPLEFVGRLTCGREDMAVTVHLSIKNTGGDHVFLRLVMPLIQGLATPGQKGQRRIVVPQEIGSVIAADPGPPIGMPLELSVGLPKAMNSMEVACLYDAGGGGGVFFADIDGDSEGGVSPIQLTASASEVIGFWIAGIAPGATITVPRLAVGIHHGGDWHEAIDFYAEHHRPRWKFAESPAWLRDQGAIYSFSGGGAGAILMALPAGNLADGAIWTTWAKDDSPWRDGREGRLPPLQVSTAGLAPAGAPIDAVLRNNRQLDVFVVGHDGAIWTTWEIDDGPWRDGRQGRQPKRVTPPCLAPPGAPIAAAKQQERQLDAFVVGHDGAVWVTWETDDGAWQDGTAGRRPRRISPPGLAPPGSHLVAAHQNDHQLDVFVVGHDGAIWVTWTVDDGPWRDGADGRMPARVTPEGFAPPGAPLAAAKQSDAQLDVFVVRDDGAIWVTWVVGDGAWTDGQNGRQPVAVSPSNFAPTRAHLAAARQKSNQLDVFVVRDDGAIWVTWVVGDGAWTDGQNGRQHPVRVSTPNLAPPGAPLCAILQKETQLDVFVVGEGGAIWATWEVNDGPWRDGADGRPIPVPVSTFNLAPAGAGVAAVRRGSGQVDAFTVGTGRIRSFRELPSLLDDARKLGTNVVYLFDYWEGTDEGGFPPYWNKGDYFLRSDLGGESAFIDGVRALHKQGGRIIVYVEPFIVYRHSEIGRAKGEAWAGRWPGGALHTHYVEADSRTMVAAFGAWQEYITSVCERLVCLCGVDGIFLDSYGWQMNWPMETIEERRLYTPSEHVQGVLQLTDRIRSAIRRIKPDAVVLGETASGPIGRHWDGGLSAEFAWDETRAASREWLRGSPVRYAVPEVTFFSNGRDLPELHQVFAAGHGLVLSSYWPGSFMYDDRDHIKRLVEIRQHYRDALIYGKQEYQPEPDHDAVVAYFYRGADNRVMTIVNTSRGAVTTNILLRATETDAVWKDLLSAGVTMATAGTLLGNVTLEGGGLRVFLRMQ